MADKPAILPNFLFIGADKAGSTWLHTILAAHPQCYVPACKDLYFFDRYFERGFDWYASYFRGAPQTANAVGELSHDYLYSEDAARRIAEYLPGVRIVVFLRNPPERTFSEYLYLVRSGLTTEPFRSALVQFPETIDHSRYAKHLRSYIERFDRKQLGVFLFEDLQSDPVTFGRQVTAFLGLDFVEDLPYAQRVLPASRPRSALAARVMKHGATYVRKLGLPGLVGYLKSSSLTNALYVPYAREERPQLLNADRVWLWEQFREDVARLESMFGFDLSAWHRDTNGTPLALESPGDRVTSPQARG